jgi:2-dehydro-3-deoxyphosphogluconate aldolase/(4S)-4-hydroxy-2-oxoglutarate aldolase
MDQTSFVRLLERLRVLAVLTPDNALEHARALAAAGVPAVQLTVHAPDTVAALVDAHPGMVIAGGTVTTAQEVREAALAGAHFVVAPAVDREVVRCGQRLGVPVVPAVGDYTEAIAASRERVPVVRLDLPAPEHGHAGVSRYARLFPRLRFLPSGEMDPDDAARYLREPAVVAVAATGGDLGALARVAGAPG